MTALAPLPPIHLGLYRHYKGGEYEVINVVRHSETLEPMVLYRALYGERGLWVRPYTMFVERVDVDGARVQRFAPIEPNAPSLRGRLKQPEPAALKSPDKTPTPRNRVA